MPTPRVPNGFKPVAQGYSIGSPQGLRMTEVAGGMPRIGLDWYRGLQPVPLARIMEADELSVWTVWFHRVINNGSIQFTCPINLGTGYQDHLCQMVPGTYSVAPVSGGKLWSVSFSVMAENPVYDMSDADALALVDFWNETGGTGDDLLARLARFATVDTLVLA